MEAHSFSPESAAFRRVGVLGLAAVTTLVGTLEMHRLLSAHGTSVPEVVLVGLFALCFGWIALSFWTAIAGFLQLALGPRLPGLRYPTPDEEGQPLASRTSVVMPIHNEDPASVFANVQATYESVAATGHLDAFDFYVLSDSTRAEAWVAEELAWSELCRRVGGQGRIFYRRRTDNTGKKAGNLGDFCERWGRRYDFTVVLDADSLMDGRTLVKMARLMELNPRAGILQAPPLNVGRTTLFARLQQFAGRVYGPVVAAGAAAWQLGESNYWGHNAIIRTEAFINHCGLPVLPGKQPFGGHILSHDFVEAALMRRAGYTVWLVPELGGSYEQPPPNLLAYAQRDRRWCQGNLQHLSLVMAGGLHPFSRGHFLMGVMSYVASPLWLLFLVSGLVAALHDRFFLDAHALESPVLAFDAPGALRLFAVSMGMLFAPKVLGLMLALFKRGEAARMGGRVKLVLSVLVESVLASLLAPVMMLFQSHFVFGTLLGYRVNWSSQQREDADLPWSEAARRHAVHMAVGVGMLAVAALVSPALVAWLLPVAVGLLLAVPLTVLTARSSLGMWAARRGLFLLPEETEPPEVVERAQAITEEHAVEPVPDAIERVLGDAKMHALHLALLESQPGLAEHTSPAALESARRKLLGGGAEPLSAQEKVAALLDVGTLSEAREQRLTRALS
ncbi:glucans biosynthesis glucosyltransferase MdoH [Myxococcus llanfairpwllgwyngyllgogerychwyrndrobwllllantysiliogogogochensis]|uniref:Glucans biosynthesis glucosyltransferase H n=1 Tax=Myxococcus llanfairpwllgwyngyllgogerychwyrndrobwllllantysiliogogogochensis TaxID=2590453 RepID=A0A540X3E7_9BACT|nr:glucans biosynthesis glucosyltransferase MdoH [Myxococcus llanfairpwllgwyngyllgogerychwyrndrobwllllantysiliogogogochensis]TQF15763.1 glucans biosynthesis glucosyltransferase MdoH [Myxococcus llanfairpwllgwyngyllgogerychwyrndrobwllllantysiliogogogochensis]